MIYTFYATLAVWVINNLAGTMQCIIAKNSTLMSPAIHIVAYALHGACLHWVFPRQDCPATQFQDRQLGLGFVYLESLGYAMVKYT